MARVGPFVCHYLGRLGADGKPEVRVVVRFADDTKPLDARGYHHHRIVMQCTVATFVDADRVAGAAQHDQLARERRGELLLSLAVTAG